MGGRRRMTRHMNPKTVYEVLDRVRTRPGMYIGDVSVVALQAFESGLSWSELGAGVPSFWAFTHWASAIIDQSTGTWSLMQDRIGPEATIAAYFDHLDRFRKCREVTLSRAQCAFR